MLQGFEQHDHGTCIADAMRAAEDTCSEKGLQFTPVRRRALEVLLEEHRALGAYEVLDRLREGGFGSQPPVAYRALDFLVANGLAHRVERLNAFIACGRPGERHAPCFLICTACDTVVEAPGRAATAAVCEAGAEVGFAVERVAVEALGLCRVCREAAA
ncbi:Fur family transcriptional regulator [Ponticoccus alexandrii]|uniref:Transcriptional repressor n=1 Tax=Ponticoccus alexandrii TaxID=1943633 RepID=A0ABX7F6K5_9RHOB|nr:Fur family transcriptional regulator [Ponticoccus alexandrii]ETA53382.1 Fur family transcriptional regulator [Rhodobacteraceae bacterium PD-2]QRF65890.1 transcriptional repressor [Ponticoccus alexandrii]